MTGPFITVDSNDTDKIQSKDNKDVERRRLAKVDKEERKRYPCWMK